MAPLSTSVEKCLSQNYLYMPKARADMKNVAMRFRALQPKVEKFIFNDGTVKEMVCLDGTIPVMYRGNTYNFPVQIWLQQGHPHESPICYVRPTANMQIKVSEHVDNSGRVYLPYLHDWNPEKGSDLNGVVETMIGVFGVTPPVFSRATPAQPQPQPPPNPALPYPMPNRGFGMPTPQPATSDYPGNHGFIANNNSLNIPDEHIRESLLSALEDRIALRAVEFEQRFKAEEEVLKKTNEELNVGKTKLTRLIDDMSRDCREMETNLTTLREKNEQLKEAVDKISEVEDDNMDEAVTTTTPLYKQLLNAYAEENAVEDTLYFLGEGLRKGVIDLDTFLKMVRELSRKQFMLRALMQKCRQKAGLPPV